MLLILLNWLYIFLLAWIWGHMGLAGWNAVFQRKADAAQHPALLFFSGLALLASAASLAWHLTPLGGGVNLWLSAVALIYAGWQRQAMLREFSAWRDALARAPMLPIAFGVVLILALALLASATPPGMYYDEGLYYLPFIKWINTYAAVPGLGCLHPRLAFNSNWHLLTALFNWRFLTESVLNDLNGLAHILLGFYALTGLVGLLREGWKMQYAFRFSLLIPTHLLSGYLKAPTADVIVVILSWLIFERFLLKANEKRLAAADADTLLITLLAALTCTIKLSAFPVVLLPLYIGLRLLLRKEWRVIAMMALATLLVLGPWMYRNYILSGYLVFPLYQLDLFNPDWKVPPEIAKEEVTYIKAFAINAFEPYHEVVKQPVRVWFRDWFSRLQLSSKGILFLALCSSILLLAAGLKELLRKGKAFFELYEGWLVLMGTLAFGLTLWIAMAPDFRFGYSYTTTLYLLMLCTVAEWFRSLTNWQGLTRYGFVALTALFYLIAFRAPASEYRCTAAKSGSWYWVSPARYGSLPVVQTDETGTFRIYASPCNDQCWDSALPCSPFTDVGAELRDPFKGLQGGFRMTNPDVARYEALQTYYQPLPGKPPLPAGCVLFDCAVPAAP